MTIITTIHRSYRCPVCERRYTLHDQPTPAYLCPYCGLAGCEPVQLIAATDERIQRYETDKRWYIEEIRRLKNEVGTLMGIKSMPKDTRGT